MTPSLEVLLCPTCGAPVPIGDEDPAKCAYCDARVPLPAAYRELRDAARLDASARSEAERLLRKMDRPPLLITKVLAAILDQPAIRFWMFYGVPVALFSILWAFSVVGDDGSFAVAVLLIFASVVVCTYVPRALGVYANRRATARALLLDGLRARPPSRPGGPASCRECGAPLAVPAGALVVRCLYCGSDNAVSVRTGALAQAAKVARTVKEAAERDRTERGATRRELVRELVRYIGTAAVFAGLVEIWGVYEEQLVGILAMVVLTLLFIALLFVSAARADRRDQDRIHRRAGNDVPDWVGVVGPIGLWVLAYLALRLF